MAELKKFDIERVFPMHCSGQNVSNRANQEMAEKLVLCSTGSSDTFTAQGGSSGAQSAAFATAPPMADRRLTARQPFARHPAHPWWPL